jgi:hypothetical protein
MSKRSRIAESEKMRKRKTAVSGHRVADQRAIEVEAVALEGTSKAAH